MVPLPLLLVFGLFAASSLKVSAQPAPLKVEKLSHLGSMPFVEAGDPLPAAAAARINQALFLQVLQRAAPVRRQDGLKPVDRKTGGGGEPVSGIGFRVHRLDARVLSLTVSYEGCGAYCENHESPFNFDVRSGREILAPDLFTPTGMKAVTALVDRAIADRIEQHLKRLRSAETARTAKAARGGDAGSDEEARTAEERIEMFEGCLKGLRDPGRHKFAFASEARFRVEAARVVFHNGRCSIHAMQALDELGSFSSPLEARNLEPHLSAYGKYLLLGGPEAVLAPSPFHSVMKGKVASAPVTLFLRAPGYEQSVSGYYFYDRFRTPIPLFGKFNGKQLELSEEAPEGKESPLLLLRVDGAGLKGEWVGAGKRLPMEVAP